MRFLRALLFISCLVVLAVNVIPNDSGVQPLRELLLPFDQHALKSRYGSDRALNHSGTRSVYHQVLMEAQRAIQASDDTNQEKALTCSLMRSEARRYARSRDATFRAHLTEAALQLRDAYVHGLKYLPLALRKDIRYSLTLQRPSFYHVALVTKQTVSCLVPALSNGECPSYLFLRTIRGKSDEDILGSCTQANKAYDQP